MHSAKMLSSSDRRQVAFIALGVEYLWNDTDINQSRRIAVSKRAGVAILSRCASSALKPCISSWYRYVYRVLVYTHLPS